MGVSNKKIGNTIGGKKKEFVWYVNHESIVIEKKYDRGKGKRIITFSRKELTDILKFINREFVVTLSNNLSKMDDLISGNYIDNDYYKKGLGPYIYNNSRDRKDIIHKVYAMTQLVSILVLEDILDYRNKVDMKFYIKYSMEKSLEDLDNMFKKDKSIERYDKLVRDKIPTIIEEEGEICDIAIAPKEALTVLLEEKLMEEVNEYLEDRNLDELADVMEVLFGLAHNLGYTEEDLLKRRAKKLEERGGFKHGVILKAEKRRAKC